MITDPAALAASIATALAATDTAARALWEAMGAPGTYWFGNADHKAIAAHFHAPGFRGYVDCDRERTLIVVRRGDASKPEIEHEGTLDSARAALAAYLGAS